jgi:hypothetical protein
MWEQKGRRGGPGPIGAGGVVCAGNSIATALAAFTQGNQPWGKSGVEKRRSVSLQPGSCHSREYDEEGVVKDYVSTGRTSTTRNPAKHCTGTETNFRVTVAAHESNCKMAHIFRRLKQTWDVG